ncbi:MAG: LysR family transcriptional regulator [Cyanobacteria bacterium P01_A01_bin.15]
MSKSLDRLTLLDTFVRIADAGSISAAARDLGLSQPSASRQLAELESRFKTQLMRRTTHDLSLSAAGAELLADARQLLDQWEAPRLTIYVASLPGRYRPRRLRALLDTLKAEVPLIPGIE